ncbi:MAG: bestrophin-like domain [Vulcanimicrobiaceae bacterium]
MVIHWLVSLPIAVSYALIVGCFLLYALGGLAIARCIFGRLRLARSELAVSTWGGPIGTMNGLLYAFVIVTLWTGLHHAQTNVNAEAVQIRMIARELAPSKRVLVGDYARSVVQDEWPLLCRGGRSSKTAYLLARLERHAVAVNPAAESDLFMDIGKLANLRYARLLAANRTMPVTLWIALILLSAVLIALMFFVNHDNALFHFVAMALIGLTIGTLFWLTVSLEFPFCGQIAVSAAPITRALLSV